jgi:hypothetical protein
MEMILDHLFRKLEIRERHHQQQNQQRCVLGFQALPDLFVRSSEPIYC